MTPLHVAASAGRLDGKDSVGNGAEINSRTDDQSEMSRTPIHLAIMEKQIEMVKLLLEMGADIDKQCNMGNALLTALVGGDNYDIAILLLNHGANPNSRTWGGYTALHYDAEWAKSGGILSLLRKARRSSR